MPEKNNCFANGYALLIGVGNYPYVNPLPVTVNDATVLYKLLTNPDRAGYPESQVKLLVNEAASRQGILDGLDWLIECTRQNPQATVLIYFSGHGGISGNKEYLLAPYEFTWSKRHSALFKHEFADKVNAVNARKLLVMLDCCHAAGIATKSSMENNFRPSNQALYDELHKGEGRVVVASSRHDQYSRIHAHAQYSVFTDALVQALDGGDGTNGEFATVLRTFAAVSDAVKKETNSLQIPVFNMDKVEDFAICRIDKVLALKQPFKHTAAYGGTEYRVPVEVIDQVSELVHFNRRVQALLDDQGFAAVPAVLDAIKQSGFTYNKPAFANLRNDGLTNLAMLAPNDYITRLKVFIGMLS
jgi:peptidyl-tRNA hydrolase